ncbi:hypothetical protein CN331_11550, partial [Bacillus cereus]|uniref:hypothetical protein n=1 Tax=Bacillus cereus TaxID=1396 RepID=UPI000BFAB773
MIKSILHKINGQVNGEPVNGYLTVAPTEEGVAESFGYFEQIPASFTPEALGVSLPSILHGIFGKELEGA